jgi:hypothetical protein
MLTKRHSLGSFSWGLRICTMPQLKHKTEDTLAIQHEQPNFYKKTYGGPNGFRLKQPHVYEQFVILFHLLQPILQLLKPSNVIKK